MALLEKHLYVRKSTIPKAGKGLFTKVSIPKGKKIVEYKGRRTVWKDVKDDDGKNGYIFYINRDTVIDALSARKELARYANDALGMVRIEGIKNNSEYVVDGKRCFIVARREIPAGSEILVGYGADYWKVIKHNNNLDNGKKQVKGKSKKKSKKKGVTKKKKKSAGKRKATTGTSRSKQRA